MADSFLHVSEEYNVAMGLEGEEVNCYLYYKNEKVVYFKNYGKKFQIKYNAYDDILNKIKVDFNNGEFITTGKIDTINSTLQARDAAYQAVSNKLATIHGTQFYNKYISSKDIKGLARYGSKGYVHYSQGDTVTTGIDYNNNLAIMKHGILLA